MAGSPGCWDDGCVKLGILCGGGPAPGMNSVISAATIEARNSGWDVLGIMDGFQHLIEGRTGEARSLSITDVSRIHVLGGSIIRTSRANPTVRDEGAADPDWRLHACLESLRKLGIDALVTIGGCDKNMPGCVMAMARLNRPSVFVYGGTILPGDAELRGKVAQTLFPNLRFCGQLRGSLRRGTVAGHIHALPGLGLQHAWIRIHLVGFV